MCYLLKFVKFYGSSQVCNHVAALLFKLEYVTRLEISNPACTTVHYQWGEPTTSSTFPASIRLGDMKFSKPSFPKYSDSILYVADLKVSRALSYGSNNTLPIEVLTDACHGWRKNATQIGAIYWGNKYKKVKAFPVVRCIM